ncbi:MAG: hypothetical protein WAR59_07460 [Ignavibacteriaceae bacterium]
MADNYEDLKRKEKITSRILVALIITVSIAIAVLVFVLISGL